MEICIVFKYRVQWCLAVIQKYGNDVEKKENTSSSTSVTSGIFLYIGIWHWHKNNSVVSQL